MRASGAAASSHHIANGPQKWNISELDIRILGAHKSSSAHALSALKAVAFACFILGMMLAPCSVKPMLSIAPAGQPVHHGHAFDQKMI
eukprot:4324216-Amphidinium_carterae.1